MRPLRTLALTFALIAAAGLLFSTVGFSAAEIDRSIEIDIVDDERAAIGYESHGDAEVNKNGSTGVDLLTITNGLNSNITEVDKELSDDIDILSNEQSPSEIGPGESGTVSATVDCSGSAQTASIDIAVTVSGEDVKSELHDETRSEFTIHCVSMDD